MASKHTANNITEEAGVPTVPRILDYESEEHLLELIAEKLGFPVFAKAALGEEGKA